jgi:hypothetical protein
MHITVQSVEPAVVIDVEPVLLERAAEGTIQPMENV